MNCYGETFMTDLALFALFEREGFSDLPIAEDTNMQEMHLRLSILLLFIHSVE